MANIIFIGPPGVGKGTQARILAAETGWFHVSTGDIFRNAYAAHSEMGIRAHDEYWGPSAGSRLVPDELTNRLAIERIRQEDCAVGFMFDGYPRTPGQAEALQEALQKRGSRIDHVVYLTAPEDVLITRMRTRESCSRCGAIYGAAVPPRGTGYCDQDETALTQRSDDSADSALRRIREQWILSIPVVTFYREQGLVQDIDGDKPVAEVSADLRRIVMR